jgi:hypothetical protein
VRFTRGKETRGQSADQLGHAKVPTTQDGYVGRKVARTSLAEVLAIFETPAQRHRK